MAAGRARLLALLALFAGGTALGAGATPSAFDFGGRYTYSHREGDVNGDSFMTRDEVSIVPVDARHAMFDMGLSFYNGHSCGIGGRATLEGDALVYRDPEMTNYGDGGPCTLRIRRQGTRLTWDDAGSCAGYCGMRGTLRDGSISLASRRPVSRAERRRMLRDHGREHHQP